MIFSENRRPLFRIMRRVFWEPFSATEKRYFLIGSIEIFDGEELDTETLRSFMEIASDGSFTAAAGKLNLAQSTVSARIRILEERLGRRLFVRERDGIKLTAAGRQFLPLAAAILRTWEQARQDIAVPEGYEHLLRLTAPAYLWDPMVMPWMQWMRTNQPEVALRLEGSYPDAAIDQLAEGLLDISIVHVPRSLPGLIFEELAVDKIVLVQHAASKGQWTDNYVFVDWGPDFRVAHDRAFGAAAKPAISIVLVSAALRYVLTQAGSAYLPYTAVKQGIEAGELLSVDGTPTFDRPLYLAYPSNPASSEVVDIALASLRDIGASWTADAARRPA
jgi:DNA-binding transcriptional LysR family regulator